MSLSKYSDIELQKELSRRNTAKETLPQPKENPDWSTLEDALIRYRDAVKANGEADDDDITETALGIYFGKEFWEWYNNIL